MLTKVWAIENAGTVSHGTLRAEDLGEAFSSLLDSIGDELAIGSVKDAAEETESRKRWNARKDDLIAEWERESAKKESDSLDEIVNDMADMISEALPEGFYFGATEGDGSDFGIWACDDADAAL